MLDDFIESALSCRRSFRYPDEKQQKAQNKTACYQFHVILPTFAVAADDSRSISKPVSYAKSAFL
jgi:hypothetical protein